MFIKTDPIVVHGEGCRFCKPALDDQNEIFGDFLIDDAISLTMPRSKLKTQINIIGEISEGHIDLVHDVLVGSEVMLEYCVPINYCPKCGRKLIPSTQVTTNDDNILLDEKGNSK